ncbi:hypothetical protein B9Z19DRAFT_1110375 [Tuber borchii]|uniref:Uncharacterized protein n=1 Tax=Tuber borchii TaxID=42251 RepID=A0A2T6ZHG5_TUBBO|nr:hypothetical protein B9Z19DRAFT_1110375 [Tuber borchii]
MFVSSIWGFAYMAGNVRKAERKINRNTERKWDRSPFVLCASPELFPQAEKLESPLYRKLKDLPTMPNSNSTRVFLYLFPHFHLRLESLGGSWRLLAALGGSNEARARPAREQHYSAIGNSSQHFSRLHLPTTRIARKYK